MGGIANIDRMPARNQQLDQVTRTRPGNRVLGSYRQCFTTFLVRLRTTGI
jgi:hypothetical protein